MGNIHATKKHIKVWLQTINKRCINWSKADFVRFLDQIGLVNHLESISNDHLSADEFNGENLLYIGSSYMDICIRSRMPRLSTIILFTAIKTLQHFERGTIEDMSIDDLVYFSSQISQRRSQTA